MANRRFAAMWPFSALGGPPPEGWRPPSRASLADLARTAGAAARLAIPLLRAVGSSGRGDRAPAAATTTGEGLREIRTRCRALLRSLRLDLEVVDEHLVPGEGGLLLMWNQTSHLDHIVLPAAIPRSFHSLFNNEIKGTPLYGRYMQTSGHFWIDRTDETQWRAQVAGVAAQIRGGACVLVSPEGTRSWDGKLAALKRGAFILARQAGAPIVCVTLVGAHERLPRGTIAVRPGRIRVVFSAPIPVASTAPGSADDTALEEQVAAAFERSML